MNNNKYNLDSDKEVCSKSLRESNIILLHVLQFVWSWLKPKNLPESPTYLQYYYKPFNDYIKLFKIIKNNQWTYDVSLRHHISAIRRDQTHINNLRKSMNIQRSLGTLYINPDVHIAIMDSILQRILWYKDNMNENKFMIKIKTIEINSLKQDIATIKIVKSLRVCCYGAQSTI